MGIPSEENKQVANVKKVTMSCTVHPSLLQRKIIHFDMDAFYASVEVRDNPSLKGKPIVVGGSPQSRGVVCTASYEARKYGIRSAMACSKAALLCPEAIFLPPCFEKYKAASDEIRTIFKKYTALIEPLSLDEAYLDVTHNERGLYATKIAKLIQDEVFHSTRLTGSAGVAPNKLLAKIASDMKKPHGLTVVLPEHAENFMRDLRLRSIHGIGPQTEKRLAQLGLVHCRDVWNYSLSDLRSLLGNRAEWIHDGSRGIDERPVDPVWVRKSLGQEQTFSQDLLRMDDLISQLATLSQEVSDSLIERRLKGRTITLKVKYADFTRITRSKTLADPVHDTETLFEVARHLILATKAGVRKIRLLGISVSGLE